MRKKDLPPTIQTPTHGLTEGFQIELQIELQDLFISLLQVEGVTMFS